MEREKTLLFEEKVAEVGRGGGVWYCTEVSLSVVFPGCVIAITAFSAFIHTYL